MHYHTVVFDLDGTLLDTLDDLADATNAALRACGYPPRSREEVRRFVGNGVHLLIERAAPHGVEEAAVERCFALFKEQYGKRMCCKTSPSSCILAASFSCEGEPASKFLNFATFLPQRLRLSIGDFSCVIAETPHFFTIL